MTVPADAPHYSIHGEFVNLALEADGVRLGRTRLQLFRPASLRVREAAMLHLGPDAVAAIDPPLVSFDPKAGRELHIGIRNNSPSIQNYVLEASGPGLTFLPARTEVSVAATVEREVSVRVFADDSQSDLRHARIRITGAAQLEQPLDLLPISRNETATYERDLDGDGTPDRILENQRVRASFSGVDGRWMEWVWKDSNTNFLSEAGAFAGAVPIVAQASSGKWEFQFSKGKRVVMLGADNRLSIQQDSPLPPDVPKPGKRDGVDSRVEKSGPNEVIYLLERTPQD